MEQQIAELLRQNQELIRALHIRDHSSSHKITVQFEKFDDENENFDSFIERFETYLDVQNVAIANQTKDCVLHQEEPKRPSIMINLNNEKHNLIYGIGYGGRGVQYKNQKVNLNLYIVKENLDTILGREWLYKIHLDWPAIKAIRAKTEQNLNNHLREYKDIFDDKLGEISNYEAKLKLRPGVKPIFCRVRTVPFALKGRVENEIDRLEREGIIEKVESSEWATPVVPVVKTDGSIRLCADYSVT
ncbi:retrovirus-related Pol polyprotein from transposon 412 [Trichonephila clavata]|uniref:Retrovirus-related Pol polyprotein from transposon 412 n=1 Tax=Trichonephila clavata TaxID=2740835 RepID=A0A8X6J1E7_TRICU|nr:retrovirus-related Pol polyprotein from transposon 412 [Trichonephila clavata]